MACPFPTGAPAGASASLRHEFNRLVGRSHELGVLYAHDDWSLLSDITLGLLLQRARIRWRYCALEHVAEIVWPLVCGTDLLQIDRHESRAERRFALQRGLVHVLACRVADLTYARHGHHWCIPEE